MCHASVAHLTRTGYSRTPSKTCSLPSSTPCSAATPVSMWWKPSKISFASVTLLPLTASVMSEVEAVQMAQPWPWKLISSMMPFSIRR